MDKLDEDQVYSIEDEFEKRINLDDNVSSGVSHLKDEKTTQTAVYNRRWLMLFVVFILNVSNGALWISFSTITSFTAEYFDVTNSDINWFSMVFYVTSIPMVFVALWVTFKYGFRTTTLVGGMFNALGSVIRLIGVLPGIPTPARYPLALTGQAVCALAQPFVISLHTKISGVWFPENQRTISTAIAAMANPFGFMVASIVSPAVVNASTDVPTMNYIICGLGIFGGLLSLTVRESRPPKPPSIAAAKSRVNDKLKSQSYVTDLYQLLKNKDFIILIWVIGGGMGVISSLETMIAQMICPWGYDDSVAGLCSVSMMIGGYIGAAVYSVITVKTKLMEEMCKVGYTFVVIAATILILIIKIGDIVWILATSAFILGFLAMGLYPVSLEVGVETTYPLDESYMSGLTVVAGQIHGVIYIPVMEALSQPLGAADMENQVCTTDPDKEVYDMSYSGLFMIVYVAVLSIILTIFFKPKYRRLEAEKQKFQDPSTLKK